MKIVINKQVYDMKNGVGLLKTLYENDYNAIPEHLKHEQLQAEWDNYEGIPKKLYQMSKSEDAETLELCIELLKKDGIQYEGRYVHAWQTSNYQDKPVKLLRSIDVFKTI